MPRKRRILRLLLPDIFVWAVVLILPIYFSPSPAYGRPERMESEHYFPYLISSIVLMLIYYINYHVLVPRFYFRRKYFAYSLFVFAALWLLVAAPETDHLFERDQVGSPLNPVLKMTSHIPHFSYFEIQIFIMGVIALIVSTFLCITRRLTETEDEKIDAELAYLKAQINPHFLFNTLNSIYSLAYQKSELTAPAIVKLSGLMRYVISDAQSEKVTLSKEIEYISNYIELQRLRLNPNTQVKYSVIGDSDSKLIAPLILLPFIENAFKYGVNPEKDSTIRVMFTITQHSLQLEVSNTIVNASDVVSERIGLGNSRDRLMKMYPDQHLLNIQQTAEEFIVTLNINFV